MLTVILRKNNFTLIKSEGDFYYIDELKDTVSTASGTLQELRSELIRWSEEIDFNNEYMLEVEKSFINALDMFEKYYRKTLTKKDLMEEFNKLDMTMNEKNYERKYVVFKEGNPVHEFRNLSLGTFYLLNLKTGLLTA